MPEVALLNGRFVAPSRAKVAIDDWALRYGWGLFETLRVQDGCPLFVDLHVARLCRSAPLLSLQKSSVDVRGRWQKDVAAAVARSRMKDAIVNCYWTRGASPSDASQVRVVRVRPMRDHPQRRVKLWVAPWRLEPTYPGVGAKTLAYFPYIFAGVSARREGFDEALLLNTSNRVCDGAASSVFVIHGGKLLTPQLSEGALAGITRAIVLASARELNIPAVETRLTWHQLLRADAVFLASALRGVVAVSHVAAVWKSGKPKNPIISAIQTAYSLAVEDQISLWRKRI